MAHIENFYIDEYSAEPNRLFIDHKGATICIESTDVGVNVFIFSLTVVDEPIAETFVSWREINGEN